MSTQKIKEGELVTLSHHSWVAISDPPVGVVTRTMKSGLYTDTTLCQVAWSAGDETRFEIEECWYNPAELKVIEDGS